jgi:hypothetical protein
MLTVSASSMVMAPAPDEVMTTLPLRTPLTLASVLVLTVAAEATGLPPTAAQQRRRTRRRFGIWS